MSNSPYIFFLLPPDLLRVELMLTSLLEGAFGMSWGPFKLLNDMSAHASMPPKKNYILPLFRVLESFSIPCRHSIATAQTKKYTILPIRFHWDCFLVDHQGCSFMAGPKGSPSFPSFHDLASFEEFLECCVCGFSLNFVSSYFFLVNFCWGCSTLSGWLTIGNRWLLFCPPPTPPGAY